MAKGRPKPLQGGKKYDKAFLKCTGRDCTNPDRAKGEEATYKPCTEEFWVSKATTPAKRYCKKHMQSKKAAGTARSTQDMDRYRRAIKLLFGR